MTSICALIARRQLTYGKFGQVHYTRVTVVSVPVLPACRIIYFTLVAQIHLREFRTFQTSKTVFIRKKKNVYIKVHIVYMYYTCNRNLLQRYIIVENEKLYVQEKTIENGNTFLSSFEYVYICIYMYVLLV